MYGSRKITLNSDDDSDLGSRYKTKSSSSYGLSSARGMSNRDMDSRDTRDTWNSFTRNSRDRDNFSRDRDSRDNFTRDSNTRDNFTRDSRDNFRDSRDNHSRDRDNRDRFDKSDKYSSYRNNNSDSSDDEPKSRYGASSRRVVRNSSDSDDSDKNDRRRMSSLKSRDPLGSSSRFSSSRGGRSDSMGMGDIDSYDGANQKLKMMIQWDKSLCEQLDDLYESKSAKEKKVEQLKDDIHKDTIKEDGLRKKLSELRMNRKILQARMDDFK